MGVWKPFILVILAMGLIHLMEQQTTLSELTNHFDTTCFQPEEYETVFDQGTLYYVTYGNSTKTPLLLIHGSPGDWTAWKELIEFRTTKLQSKALIH